MPWQNLVADIALEVNPATGLLAYRYVIVKLPRQAGKTTLTRAVAVHRALAFTTITRSPQNIIYTAQTAQDAYKKWLQQAEELEKLVPNRVTLRPGNNNPALLWANGSEHRPLSVTQKSGPSQSNDLLVVDEAWAHEDGTLEGNLSPTMIARQQPQMWILSNAGKANSNWWREKCELGQELAEAGDVDSGICYIEWSADRREPGFDRTDPELAARHHPATGYTINAAVFKAELLAMRKNPDEYDRAYLNLEPKTGVDSIVDMTKWADGGDDDSMLVGTRGFALDIALDRSWASVSWAGKNQAGRDMVEVIKHERGVHWVIPFLLQRLPRNNSTTVVVAAGTPAALMAETIEKAGENAGIPLTVVVISRAEYAAECGKTFDGIKEGTLVHLATGQDPLDEAIEVAAWSTGANKVWARTDTSVDITSLVSCTVARRAHAIAVANEYDVLDSVG